MLLKETMKATGLSKKAIQYYEDKALIVPKKLNNGYRDYDETVIQQLKKSNTCVRSICQWIRFR